MDNIESLVETLRAGVDVDSFDVAIQKVYESWLKRDAWAARAEVLALIVGIDPPDWQEYLDAHDLREAEQDLWASYRREAGIMEPTDPVAVGDAVAFYRTRHIDLPASFSRLYDFIRQTTLTTAQPEAATRPDDAASRERADETEAVLGAALSLVASMPHRCRDEHGFVDGAIIAKLILQSAVRWFPLQPPTMSEAEMTGLIDKWLQ